MKPIAQIELERQQQLQAINELLKQDMRDMFMGLSVPAIKEMIQYDDEPMLKSLLEIALENEDYEICTAVNLVLQERHN